VEDGSAGEDSFSSGLSSVGGFSAGLSALDDEGGGVSGSVVLGAEAVGEGCGVEEAVLGCKTDSK